MKTSTSRSLMPTSNFQTAPTKRIDQSLSRLSGG
jgi:hypothetical protein